MRLLHLYEKETFSIHWSINLLVFLVACTQLYKPLCLLVGPSVGRCLLRARDLWRSALLLLKLMVHSKCSTDNNVYKSQRYLSKQTFCSLQSARKSRRKRRIRWQWLLKERKTQQRKPKETEPDKVRFNKQKRFNDRGILFLMVTKCTIPFAGYDSAWWMSSVVSSVMCLGANLPCPITFECFEKEGSNFWGVF